MNTSAPEPPTEAARQYLAIRELSTALMGKLIGMKGTVHPLTAARALGIPVSGKTICFDGEWEVCLLSEYTFFYHLSKGKCFFQRALAEAGDLTPAERDILECHQRAFTSVFEIQESRSDLWEVDLRDVLGERGTVTIIDRNFSQMSMAGGLVHVRLIPYELHTATSGTALPLLDPDADEEAKAKVLRFCRGIIANPGKRTRQLALLYACRKIHIHSGPEIRYE